jgi:hypothetical protein
MIVAGEKVVSTVKLSGGMANQGVFRHTMASGAVVVEKRTRRLNEIVLCKNAMSKQTSATIPEIVNFTLLGKSFHIFMESVDLLGYDFLSERNAGTKMARFVYDLHAELKFLRTPYFDNNHSQLGNLSYVKKMFHKSGDVNVVEKLREVEELLDRHSPVFSHNDLFLGNIGVREDNSLVAFDFGLVGLNFVGAEFHHFLGRSPKLFFEELLTEYSKLSGIDRGTLLGGAVLYAGIRQFLRKKKNTDLSYCRAILADSVVDAHKNLVVKFF